MNQIQNALRLINEGLAKLESAAKDLRQAKNPQLIELRVAICELTVVRNILVDPECTPEISEGEEEAWEMTDRNG